MTRDKHPVGSVLVYGTNGNQIGVSATSCIPKALTLLNCQGVSGALENPQGVVPCVPQVDRFWSAPGGEHQVSEGQTLTRSQGTKPHTVHLVAFHWIQI